MASNLSNWRTRVEIDTIRAMPRRLGALHDGAEVGGEIREIEVAMAVDQDAQVAASVVGST